MRTRLSITGIALLSLLAVAGISSAQAPHDHDRQSGGAVFTTSNSPLGNMVLAYRRSPQGALVPFASYSTGGLGTGAGLGSQNAVVLTPDHRWLLTVNAGSNDVSTFAVRPWGLELKSKTPSGGNTPISLTVNDDTVYVLNAGDGNNITGFRLTDSGKLKGIFNSTNSLSGAQVGPAEVQFSRDGDLLVVSEKATSQIDTFIVDHQGRAKNRKTFAAAGTTPFGFSVGKRNRLFVSEAFGGAMNGSALSSYDTKANGDVSVVSASSPTHQTAACWTAIDSSGRFVYTTNAGSASVSGFKIDQSGQVSLLEAGGLSGSTPVGSHPIDATITENDKFLYVLTTGNIGITGFRRANDGSLSLLGTTSGQPAGTSGLASW